MNSLGFYSHLYSTKSKLFEIADRQQGFFYSQTGGKKWIFSSKFSFKFNLW